MTPNKSNAILAAILVVVGALGIWYITSRPTGTPSNPVADPRAPQLGPSWVGATANYQITSRATVEQTTQVGSTAEALLRSYLQFFALTDKAVPKGGLKLTLYRNREQFKQRHPQPAWAEAVYRRGVSYAYFDAKAPNSVHWMLHEATHQLNELVGHTPKEKWVNEGLASYFGASRLEDFTLTPGRIEPKAYPVWWLDELRPTGDMKQDFASGRVVPLRALITGEGGPDIDKRVNEWYLGYWSLTHFLLHGLDGKYAPGYRKLLAGKSATLADFEREIGPVAAIEAQWYAYLQDLKADGQAADSVIVVD